MSASNAIVEAALARMVPADEFPGVTDESLRARRDALALTGHKADGRLVACDQRRL